MHKRIYKLSDVQEYLKEYYKLDWKGCKIRESLIDDGIERGIRATDFRGFNSSYFSVNAVVYDEEQNRKRVVFLYVSNTDLTVNFDRAEVSWNDFLDIKKIQSNNI